MNLPGAANHFQKLTSTADGCQLCPGRCFLTAGMTICRAGKRPHFSGRNNLRVLAVIQAAIESLSSGAFVDIADPLREGSAS